MSRRDTIIVAILVNAGLLMVLFATAVRSKESKPSMPQPSSFVATAPRALANPAQQNHVTPTSTPKPDSLSSTKLNQLLTFDVKQEEILFEDTPSLSDALAVVTSTSPKEQAPEISLSQPHIVVVVKKGDVLEKIAKEHHASINDIMAINQLKGTHLRIGQQLKIPTNQAKEVAKLTPAAVEKEQKALAQAEYYTVKDGDNPWLIASKSNIKLQELLRLNNLDEAKAKKLRPGDRLRVR